MDPDAKYAAFPVSVSVETPLDTVDGDARDRFVQISQSEAKEFYGATNVWLVHGSHTGGHASAARSLKEALERHPGVSAEIVNMAETSSNKTPASTAAEVALKGGDWVRNIRSWVFNQQYEGNGFLKWFSNMAMKREGNHQEAFLNRLEQEKPDALVSTMSATNSLLSIWSDEGVLRQPVQSVLTDFASHQMWAQDNIAKYYVATPAVKQDLEKFGVEADKVAVTGIPIKRDFASPAQSPQEARQALGLDPEKPLVLMLGGSLGYGSFSESLSAMDSTEGDFQMAAITGKNENLRRELEELDTSKDLHVEGYVTNMPTWIDAADLVVTKPGGLTCSEILAKGKPMILQHADSGLEGRLVRRLEESGVALVVDGAKDMARTVSELIKEPQKLDALKAKARAVGKPTSSDEIADSILRSIRSAS